MEGFPSAVVMAEYIDAMLELIPAKFYFQQEGDPDQWRSKFSKNTKKSKQMAAYKQDKRAEAREHKKEKFDTAEKQSLKRKLHAQQEAKNKKNGGKGGQAKRGRSSSERDSDNADSDGDDSAPGLAPTQRADSLDALRERLTMKIQLMRTGRSGQGRPRPRNFESRRGAKSASKRSGETGDGDDEETSSKSAKRASQQAQTKEQAKIASSLGTDVDQIDFNSFTFDAAASRQNAGVDDTVRGTGSASGERLGSRKRPNLRKLVQKADEKAKRIRALKESGEAPEEVAREAWDSALLKAKGGKPLDDVKYLKKKLKAQERKKAKSAKEWKARDKAVAKAKAEKQTQRAYNIANRQLPKNARVNPVTGEPLVQPRPGKEGGGDDDAGGGGGGRGGQKGGRGGKQARPGFEGRARGFLNKPAAGGRKGGKKK